MHHCIMGGHSRMYLIPKPKQLIKGKDRFYISGRTRIVLDGALRQEGDICVMLLQECIGKWAGFTPAPGKGRQSAGDIFLTIDPAYQKQEYRLVIAENGITAAGGDRAGLLYAAETLCQIIEQQGGAPECVEILDAPDIGHRGYYLDETRGRVLKLEYLKKTVDRLCRYKINEFQLYIEHTYMFEGFSEMWRNETPLTAQEILELDRYCRQRCVELIPSLASFGHLYMLLSTRSCGELCELEDSVNRPFSFEGRMQHHTINASDERALPLIKGMIEEYMSLFSSDKFNICADETFDLGKGKSKTLAEEKGVHRIYIDYVKELCTFLKDHGKTPMFWGDVICAEPGLIQELPEETICLTWGYAKDQREDESRDMAKAGASQYLCPGVCGWNQWVNLIEDSYHNITRMCGYAEKYQAVGILNTDWGDFGHINHPAFSVPGMIYGAAFSWNHETVPFEEMNRQISRIEYHDRSEQFTGILAQISRNSLFGWETAVVYYETARKKTGTESAYGLPDFGASCKREAVHDANTALEGLRRQLKENAVFMDSSCRGILRLCDVTMEGIAIWNEIGAFAADKELGKALQRPEQSALELAKRLEVWFMDYKNLWRETAKEGDLGRISEIVFWYADLLRE